MLLLVYCNNYDAIVSIVITIKTLVSTIIFKCIMCYYSCND